MSSYMTLNQRFTLDTRLKCDLMLYYLTLTCKQSKGGIQDEGG